MTDYQSRIDAQTWAFIRRTEDCYPSDATGFTIADHRQVYDDMARAFHAGRPGAISTKDVQFSGVECRVYQNAAPHEATTVMYFHGGGFVLGGLDSHDDVCAEISHRTGFRVVSVDYRLCPEYRHPVQFDDCINASRSVAAAYGSALILCGDSAGGNLAAAVSHAARGSALKILRQVLIYPGLGGDPDQGSYMEHAHAPMLTRDEIVFYKGVRFHEDPGDDPTYAPLRDRDFGRLPPTHVFSAECDPLSDDGDQYCAAIRNAGGQAVWINETGLVHGYLRARHTVDRAKASFDRIIAAISKA